jgi:hypothetical protein
MMDDIGFTFLDTVSQIYHPWLFRKFKKSQLILTQLQQPIIEIQDVFQSPNIRWHQRFTIDGVTSPGYHDMDLLISNAEVPVDLTG